MFSLRSGTFLLLSLLVHVALFFAALSLTAKEPDDKVEPLLVIVTTPDGDPGKGRGNTFDPAPTKPAGPEEKVKGAPERKPATKSARNSPGTETEKRAIDPPEDDSGGKETAPENSVASGEVTGPDHVPVDGEGTTSGIGDSGYGLGDRGTGRGAEIGPPNHFVNAVPNDRLNPEPNYPEIAKRRGYEGLVVLTVLVSDSGHVGKIDLRESSGYDVLDTSAADAVRRWTFIPAKRNGQAVSSWVVVPIRFVLTNG
jgi:periplasmic protein TonB